MKVFDAHFHIIDYKYLIQENNGFKPDEFTYSDYDEKTRKMGLDIEGGAIISGSFQGLDTKYLDVIKKIKEQDGKSDFVGVINLPPDINYKQVLTLNELGVTGARFNIFRGNATSVDQLVDIANRL